MPPDYLQTIVTMLNDSINSLRTDVNHTLDRVESKLDSVACAVTNLDKSTSLHISSHESRLFLLEQKVNKPNALLEWMKNQNWLPILGKVVLPILLWLGLILYPTISHKIYPRKVTAGAVDPRKNPAPADSLLWMVLP